MIRIMIKTLLMTIKNIEKNKILIIMLQFLKLILKKLHLI